MQYQLGMLRGYVRVNDELQTNVSNIWAGDVIGKKTDSRLATPVGAHDGVIVAKNALAGVRQKIDDRVIPRVIFTDPQVAVVGQTDLYDLIDMIHVYPTMTEALKIAAISHFKDPAKLSCCAE